jgi:hypothetical protein
MSTPKVDAPREHCQPVGARAQEVVMMVPNETSRLAKQPVMSVIRKWQQWDETESKARRHNCEIMNMVCPPTSKSDEV